MSKKDNKTLKRQLKRLGLDSNNIPSSEKDWQKFLKVVESTYMQYDEDRYLLERSLEISSKEMTEELEKSKKMSLHLAQVGKMASLGTLASGIAHELNNPLAVIKGFVEILVKHNDKLSEEKKEDFLNRIINMSDRMALIIKNMLRLSRQTDDNEHGAVDLKVAFQECLDLFSNKLKSDNIQIILECHTEECLAEGNVSQFFGIFQNLISNSCDAFINTKDRQGRKIEIHINEGMDDFLQVTLEDTAGGMTTEIYNKIFDPFFTTKEVGKGTGLGLAITKQTIEDIGGFMEVETQLGEGTKFSLLFPRFVEKEEITSIGEVSIDKSQLDQFLNNKKNILIVDDEEEILEYLNITLSDHYKIKTTTKSEDAIHLIENNGYDLIITDLKMPQLGGEALAELVRMTGISTPILFMSGHIDLSPKAVVDEERFQLINKPLPGTEELLLIIGDLISEKRAIA